MSLLTIEMVWEFDYCLLQGNTGNCSAILKIVFPLRMEIKDHILSCIDFSFAATVLHAYTVQSLVHALFLQANPWHIILEIHVW